MSKSTDGRMDGRMEERRDGRTDEPDYSTFGLLQAVFTGEMSRMSKSTDGRIYGRMEGRTDGRTDDIYYFRNRCSHYIRTIFQIMQTLKQNSDFCYCRRFS